MAYSEEQIENIFKNICFRIAEGESVRDILKNNDMPSRETFYKWLIDDKNLSDQYARACEIRAEGVFEEILDIADDGTNDYMTITKGDMEYNVEDREVTSRSKLRVQARQWWLSKVHPKKYGDKLDVTTDGQQINNSIPLVLDDGRTYEDLKNELKPEEE